MTTDYIGIKDDKNLLLVLRFRQNQIQIGSNIFGKKQEEAALELKDLLSNSTVSIGNRCINVNYTKVYSEMGRGNKFYLNIIEDNICRMFISSIIFLKTI